MVHNAVLLPAEGNGGQLCSTGVGAPVMSACQLLSRAEQAGPHGADRAVEHLRRRLVGHVEQLGEHERLELRAGQPCEEHRREARLDPVLLAELETDPFHETTVSLSKADVVGAHVAADPQQPCHHRGIASERADRSDRSQIGLLHQILDLTVRAQRVAQLPDLRLGEGDELRHRRIITLDRPGHHLAENPVGPHQ